MAKCLNCAKNATYNVKNAGAPAQDFCDAHLPKFFNKKNLPLHVTEVKTLIAAEPPVVEAPKPAKKKAVAEPTPEPTPEAVAEAVAEEPVAE